MKFPKLSKEDMRDLSMGYPDVEFSNDVKDLIKHIFEYGFVCGASTVQYQMERLTSEIGGNIDKLNGSLPESMPYLYRGEDGEPK